MCKFGHFDLHLITNPNTRFGAVFKLDTAGQTLWQPVKSETTVTEHY